MRNSSRTGGAIAGALLLASNIAAQVSPIIIKGKHFFYSSNQTQFYMRGVAYQQDYVANGTVSQNADYTDPLADYSACKRDIPYLKRLRTNVIRTYAVNPESDHTACMNAFADAGIYVISDLSAPTTLGSINRNSPEWTTDLFSRYTALIDDLSQFENTLGFFAGNEVTNSQNTTGAAAFVKAAVRDSKYYIAQNVNRPLYVGYATSDDTGIRDQVADYMNCESDTSNNVDFYGYNIYSWCGDSTYQQSGYAERTEFFESYSVPVFFAEYGCNEVEPRPFTEVAALFSEPMTSVWSGGIVYQYFQETNNYGLVNVQDNSVTPRQDFDNLSSQIAKISPTSTAYSAVPTTASPASCPSVDATWLSTPSPLPNRPNAELCSCITPVFPCVVNDDTDEDDYGDLFGFVCGAGDYCGAITHNSTTGDYGAYSMCDAKTQLSYVMSKYYVANQKKAGSKACDFSGAASTQNAQSPTGTCESLIKDAGSNGQGTVPSSLAVASYTAAAGSGSGSGSGSGGSSTGNAAAHHMVPKVEHGLVFLGFYVVVAGVAGAGMLLL